MALTGALARQAVKLATKQLLPTILQKQTRKETQDIIPTIDKPSSVEQPTSPTQQQMTRLEQIEEEYPVKGFHGTRADIEEFEINPYRKLDIDAYTSTSNLIDKDSLKWTGVAKDPVSGMFLGKLKIYLGKNLIRNMNLRK